MFSFLSAFTRSAGNTPVYPQKKCSSGYFDTYSYNCNPTLWYDSTQFTFDEGSQSLKCINGLPIAYDGATIKCLDVSQDPNYVFFPEDSFYYAKSAVIDGINEDRLEASYVACLSSGKKDPKHCQYVANYYSATKYTDSVAYSSLFSRHDPGSTNGYAYWSKGIPWVSYPISLNAVNENDLITTKFSYQDIVTFILATYSRDGKFLGFKELQRDLNFCGGDQNVTELWRIFGSNYKNKCDIDISRYLSVNSNFYEPFFLEDGVLRPIPVVIKDSESKKPFRRFFVYNDFTSQKKVVLSNMSIIFELRDDKAKTIQAPVFEVTYNDTLSNTTNYNFNVFYTNSFSSIWKSVIIVAAVFGSFSLPYFIFRVYTFTKHAEGEGIDYIIINNIIGELFQIAGIVLFFIVFVFSVYILIFFKWQKDIYMFLPKESELRPFVYMQWAAFVCVAISSFIKIFQTTSNDVFIIDWEEKRDKDVPISSWRRIMVTNEWVRVFSTRKYNVPFTLIIILFILTGLKTELMASPIPSTELYDTGYTYKVLRFAYTSFIWLLFMLGEWIFSIIYWMFIGNPFTNFLDLAATANCSILILCSKSYGYYLHGRSIHVNADETMEKMHANLASESQGKVGLRGLVPNTDNQVFEVFLHPAFRNKFNETYEGVQNSVNPKKLANEKVFSSASVSHEALASYERLNKFLQKFINDQAAYEVNKPSILQKALNIAPTVAEKSIFLINEDISFSKTMFAGMEFTLMIFLLLLFTGIETETGSPPIAAFTTFLIDQIIESIVISAGRSNIAKKSLIDNRFIMSS